MARIKGRNLNIFLSTASGGAGKAIAYATSSSLEVSKQTETTIDKDSSTVGILETTKDEWTMSTENIVADDMSNAKEVIDALLSDKLLTVSFALVGNPNPDGVEDASKWTQGTAGYTGQCKCTQASINAPAEGKATISATFTGSGALKPVGSAG